MATADSICASRTYFNGEPNWPHQFVANEPLLDLTSIGLIYVCSMPTT